MSSWKKTGGINYNSKFNTVRVQNAVSGNSTFIQDIGDKNTVTNVNSDLKFKENASLFSSTAVLDDRCLVAFYHFTDISDIETTPATTSLGTIKNKATYNYGNNYSNFDHSILDLEFIDLTLQTPNINANKAIQQVTDSSTIEVPQGLLTEKNDFLHFDRFLRFEGRTCDDVSAEILTYTDTPCKAVISKQSVNFNNYNIDDRIRGGGNIATSGDYDISANSGKYNHQNSLTVLSWIRINKYDIDQIENMKNPSGFLLFSLDDSVEGIPDTTQERLCFWVPGHENGGFPQVHFGGKPKFGSGSNVDSNEQTPDINVKTQIQIPYNKWTLVALVINGNRAYIYQEAENPRQMILSQEIFIGDYRVPEKNIIVNGSRFYDFENQTWLSNPNNITSTINIDIVDFKVYKNPLDLYTIRRIYEHDNPFYVEKINFKLDTEFAKFGNDLVVGNDVYIKNDLVVSNNVKTMGVSETYNNAFVAGSLGVGIQNFDNNFRLNVIGNLKCSGDLFIGDGDQDNSIFFKGVGASAGENPSSSVITERLLSVDETDPTNPRKQYSELLFSKGIDVMDPDVNGLISDSIRLRAPNLYIHTFDANSNIQISEDSTDPIGDPRNSNFVFDQHGFFGIKTLRPRAEIDVRGTIHITDDKNNIYIANKGDDITDSNDPNMNVGIGPGVFDAPHYVLQGDENVAIGANSSNSIQKGNQNTSIGSGSLKLNSDGNKNVAIGYNTLNNIFNTGCDRNIAIGANSGRSESIKKNNIFIGADADVSGTITPPQTISNSMAIGPGAKIATSESANISNSSANFKVGINTEAPAYNLEVIGDLRVSNKLIINDTEFEMITSGDGTNTQLAFNDGIVSKGRNFFTDLTLFSSLNYANGLIEDQDYDFDFKIEHRNMMFKNYPPSEGIGSDDFDKGSNTYLIQNQNTNRHKDNAITFDGNMIFQDSWNQDRTRDKGFTIKDMDVKIENDMLIEKTLTIERPDYQPPQDPDTGILPPIEDFEPSITVNPTTNQIHNNADTYFTNHVYFGDTNRKDTITGNTVDVSGNENKVFFNNKEVEFTDDNKNIYVKNNLTVYGTLTATGGMAQAGNTSMVGDQLIDGKIVARDPDFLNYGNIASTDNTEYTDIGFDIAANTIIRGSLTVDGSFNFKNIVEHNVVTENHQTVNISERVVINNTNVITNVVPKQDVNLRPNFLIERDHSSATIFTQISNLTFTYSSDSDLKFISNTNPNLQNTDVILVQNDTGDINKQYHQFNIVSVTLIPQTTTYEINVTSSDISGSIYTKMSSASTNVYLQIPGVTITQAAKSERFVIYDHDVTSTLSSETIFVLRDGSGMGIYDTYTVETSTVSVIADDAPALHVTQHGDSHNIAEFYDAEVSDNSGLVFQIGNNGVTHMYGRFGINKVPDETFSLDITGNTRIGGTDSVSTFNNKMYIGPNTSPSPLCTVDISANDAIRIPVGNTNERVDDLDVKEGMVRYNNETGHLEYYGKATDSKSGSIDTVDIDKEWVRVAAGGRISHTDNIFIDVSGNERLTIDTSGNVRIGEGRVQPDARLHIDISGNTNDILKITRQDDDKYKNLITSREITDIGQAIDFTSTYFSADTPPDPLPEGWSQTYTSTDYDSITITPEGKIGFGTKNPEKRIHVVDANDCEMNLVSGENKLSGINLYDKLDTNDSTNSTGGRIEYDGLSNKINLFHHNQGYKTTINESGFLGINTDDPKSLLHIHETTTNSDQKEIIRLTNFNDTDDITHQASFKLGKYNGITNDTSMLELHLHNSSSLPVIRARSDGKVGINANDQSMDSDASLQVVGGNLVVGQLASTDSIEQKREIKLLGHKKHTVFKHKITEDTLDVTDGMFQVEITDGQNTTQPLSIDDNNIKFATTQIDMNEKIYLTTTDTMATFDVSGVDLTISGNSQPSMVFTDASGIALNMGVGDTKKIYLGDGMNIDKTGNLNTQGNIDICGNIICEGKVDCNGTAHFGNAYIEGSSNNAVFQYAPINTLVAGSTISGDAGNSFFTTNSDMSSTLSDGDILVIDDVKYTITGFGADKKNITVTPNVQSTISDYLYYKYSGVESALIQTSSGKTTMAASSGESIVFNIGSDEKASISNSGVFSMNEVDIKAGSGEFDDGKLFAGQKFSSTLPFVNLDTSTNATNKPILNNSTSSPVKGMGVLDDYVYVSGKQFHVSGYNSNTDSGVVRGVRGMVVDPTDLNDNTVTIQGNLKVTGRTTSNIVDATVNTESIVQGLRNVEINNNNDKALRIGVSGTTTYDNYSAYMFINGSSSTVSTYALGAMVTEQYVAAASDVNLKENIFTINSALDKTNRMRGVYFNKKGSDRREVGVIAQEVEKVFPEVVLGEEGKKTVCYANLCGVLIEAIKDLSRENMSQNAEITSLKNKVTGLQNDIATIWDHKRNDDRKTNDAITDLKRELDTIKRSKH